MSGIQKAAGTTQRALAPIERIPYDVLRLIFEEGAKEKDRLAQVRFALYMSSICQIWRAIAHDLPSLWSTIHISLGNAPPLSLLESTLHRSRLCLLDIFVEWTEIDEGALPRGVSRNTRLRETSYILPAIYLLVQHISRWKSADIAWKPSLACLPASIDDLFVSHHLVTAGALKDMKVYGMDFFGRRLCAPHLRSLEVEEMPADCNFDKLAERCPALSDFSWLGRRNGPECLENPSEMLKPLQPLAGQLRRLKVAHFTYTDTSDPEGEPLTSFQMLKIMEFSGMDPEDIDGFLSAFTAPQLEELIVRDIWDDLEQPYEWDPAEHFIRHPSLRTLCIEPAEAIPAHYKGYSFSFLHVFRSVRINYGVDYRKNEMHDIMKMLSRRQGRIWYFPDLVCVKIYCTAAFPVDLLRQLVGGPMCGSTEQHISTPQALRQLTVYTKGKLSKKNREWFQSNLKAFIWSSEFPSCDVDPLAVRYPNGHNAIELVNDERDL